MIHDLGLTFGAASFLNKAKHAASFEHWQEEPFWNDRGKCIAQLKGSIKDHFSHPEINEAGRAFLAGLLIQLTDAQLRDLFETARQGSPAGRDRGAMGGGLQGETRGDRESSLSQVVGALSTSGTWIAGSLVNPTTTVTLETSDAPLETTRVDPFSGGFFATRG